MKDDKKKQSSLGNLGGNYAADDLNEELERLARTFQQELDKAKQDAELSEQLDDIVQGLPEEEKPDEADLCACCGERRRDKSVAPDYEYCSVCREAMRRYPLSIPALVLTVALAVVAIVSAIDFCGYIDGYEDVRLARKAEKESRPQTAVDYYDLAIAIFESDDVVPKRLYLDSADDLMFALPRGRSSMDDISNRLQKAVDTIEAKIPLFGRYNDLNEEAGAMTATLDLVEEAMNDDAFADFDGKDEEMYQQILARLDALADQTVTVDTLAGGTVTKPVDLSILYLMEYIFAYSTNHTDDTLTYLQKTEEAAPERVSLYAYEMGLVLLQNGDANRAKKYAEKLYAANKDSVFGPCLYATVYRFTKKPDEAHKWADIAIDEMPDDSDLKRQKAMIYLSEGKAQEAYELLGGEMNNENFAGYAQYYMTYIVAAHELGKSENQAAAEEKLEALETEYTDRMNDYLNGKITAVQLFTEGTGDVE